MKDVGMGVQMRPLVLLSLCRIAGWLSYQPRIADHEGHLFCRDRLSGDDEVAFILSILRVKNDNKAAFSCWRPVVSNLLVAQIYLKRGASDNCISLRPQQIRCSSRSQQYPKIVARRIWRRTKSLNCVLYGIKLRRRRVSSWHCAAMALIIMYE